MLKSVGMWLQSVRQRSVGEDSKANGGGSTISTMLVHISRAKLLRSVLELCSMAARQ